MGDAQRDAEQPATGSVALSELRADKALEELCGMSQLSRRLYANRAVKKMAKRRGVKLSWASRQVLVESLLKSIRNKLLD